MILEAASKRIKEAFRVDSRAKGLLPEQKDNQRAARAVITMLQCVDEAIIPEVVRTGLSQTLEKMKQEDQAILDKTSRRYFMKRSRIRRNIGTVTTLAALVESASDEQIALLTRGVLKEAYLRDGVVEVFSVPCETSHQVQDGVIYEMDSELVPAPPVRE